MPCPRPLLGSTPGLTASLRREDLGHGWGAGAGASSASCECSPGLSCASVLPSALSPGATRAWVPRPLDTCISHMPGTRRRALGVWRVPLLPSQGPAELLQLPSYPQAGLTFHLSPLLASGAPRLPMGGSIRTSSSLCPPRRAGQKADSSSPSPELPSCSDQTPLLPALRAPVPPAQARNS